MNNVSAAWTGAVVAKLLGKHDKVAGTDLLAPQKLLVRRTNDLPEFLLGTTAAERLDDVVLRTLLDEHPDVSFVVNVPKESFATGAALKLARARGIPVGGVLDLLRVVKEPDVRLYTSKEFGFIERGLKQHTRVTGIERMDDRRYRIKRGELPDVVAVFVHDYELTADRVRTIRDQFVTFSDVVIANPNGKATASALRAAASSGCAVYKWGEFYGRLNKP
jgi:hypothetical protein